MLQTIARDHEETNSNITKTDRRFVEKSTVCLWVALLLVVPSSVGCVSLVANLMHAIHGNNVPAEFEGLNGKRVALVCSTDEGFRSTATSTILVNNLHAALNTHLDEIQLVRNSEIDKWMDLHGQSETNYYEIGKGVKSDLVLAVEVSNLRLKNGQTLFRGEADIVVTVYDIASDGKIIFRKQMPEFAFPQTDGKPVSETSENKFRSFYLAVLTRKISGLFYPVDSTADYALDATMSSF
ncbi:MAG: hypothetical protein AB8B50_21045 [Pirellulaceae bacterium]